MAKFLIGVLTGVILVGLILIIVVFALFNARGKPPDVADNSVLVLSLNGEIPERAPVEFPFPLFGERPTATVENVWMMLRKAAADSRVKAVVLQPEGLDAGWGKLAEIRADLEQFRKSGKPLVAFLKTPGLREYYLATAADRIYLGPQDPMMVKGLRAEIMFFKNTLSKIGVNVEIEHAGKYKDFGDMFTRTNMSPETREVLNSILDDRYGAIVTRIAQGRRKTADEVRAIIDTGPFSAGQALATGLVDELRFEDQVFGELKSRLKVADLKKLTVDKYLRIPAGSLGLEGKQRVALLVAEGAITRGDPGDTGISESGITSEGFVRLLRQVANDALIKGVVVRIDSPGGEVTASDDIWREMNLLSKKKPTVISMSDVAASGGYYMAMTGDPIVAYPGTLTGSIGVVFGKPDLHGLYDKLGITKDSLKRGRFADIDSDYKALSPEERRKLREGIDESYKEFVTKVAQARHRKFEQVEPVSQGRVWLGSQARQNGLVDELGGLDRAIELVKQKAKIPASDKVAIVNYPPRRSIFDVIFKKPVEESVEAKLGPRLSKLLRSAQAKLWMRGGMLRLMPYSLELR